MDKMKDVSKLQEDWNNLLSSGHMTKKAVCDLVIPFRDKYGLTDGQALQIARNEISLSEINSLLE